MAQSVIQQTCIGRTCLKWSIDGSLSENDRDEPSRQWLGWRTANTYFKVDVERRFSC